MVILWYLSNNYFSGKIFISERLGIQKGDIVCPNTLNIITDAAVVRHMKATQDNITTIQFYAAEWTECIGRRWLNQIKQMLELLKKNYLVVVLEIRLKRTEIMTMHAKKSINHLIGSSYKQKFHMMTSYEWCNKIYSHSHFKVTTSCCWLVYILKKRK